MSDLLKQWQAGVTRREVLRGGIAIAGACVLGCDSIETRAVAQPAIQKALEDPKIEQGFLDFDGGRERINAYMARPKAKGQYPVVLVVTGNSISEEYIPNTVAMLAQAGLVGFAPNIFWLQKEKMTGEEKRRVFAEEITDSLIYADLFASLTFVRSQPFVRGGKTGITGFCFGGRCALMFATQCADIAAVVPFYGNLKTPAFAKREQDPVDVAGKIRAAVQGHYAKDDGEIPQPQLKQFEHDLRRNQTRVELFTYDAPHGFFAYTRDSYRAEAAKRAWGRTVKFLRKTLGH